MTLKNHLCVISGRCLVTRQYVSAPGLSGVPDVPHTVNVSQVTGGSGVGVSKEPPVNTRTLNINDLVRAQVASNLSFQVKR